MSRLLLVEDDPALGKRTKRGLEKFGFEVDWCQDGEVGLERAIGGDFDAILLDWNLGDSPGASLLPAIRDYQSSARVVVVTGEQIDPRKHDGVHAVHIKASSLESLLEKIAGDVS